MATIYVSTTGSDSGSGASGSPVKSITKAAQLAKAGDTVLVAAGTYKGTVSIATAPPRARSPSSPSTGRRSSSTAPAPRPTPISS